MSKTLAEKLGDYKERDISKILESESLLTRKEKLEMLESDDDMKKRLLKMFEDISEEDLSLIMKKEKQQNDLFIKMKMRDRKPVIMEIKLIHEDLSNEEIWKAYQDTEDEEMAIQKLFDSTYLKELRKRIAMENKEEKVKKEVKKNEDDIMDESEEGEEEEDEDVKEKKKKKKKKNYARFKLKLDDALAKKDTKEGWSPARIIAFNAENENLNAYLYRFNPNNEIQKNGKWTQEETELFLKRVDEFKQLHGGSIQKWGLFSQTIPGRVGYQCANFYRSLIKKGTIKDPDYYIQGGQVKHVFGRGKKRKDGEEKKRKSKRKKDDDENNQISEDEEEVSKIKSYKSLRHMNPLPGFIDPMTMQEVEKPAISKYGHVLGIATWEKILKDNPVCPFTNQKLNIYDLTKLTFDNVDSYKDLIINNQ